MGRFSGLFKRHSLVKASSEPVTPPAQLHPAIAAEINRSQLIDYFSSYERVPRSLAMKVASVYRGVVLISGAIGSLQLERWRDGKKLERTPFLEHPEDWRPYCGTIAATVADMIFYSSAWWLVVARDSWTGYPTKVTILDPELVTVDYEPGSDEIVREQATYKGRPVDPRNLIRFDGPLGDGLLVHGRIDILTALALEEAAKNYATPGVPTGILKQTNQYELTPEESSEVVERWEASRRLHTTALLGSGIDYQSITSTAADMQLVEGREESVRQIARRFGLPARYLGVSTGNSMTYTNLESERRELIDTCYKPYFNAIEQRLSMNDRNGSPRGQEIRFDLEEFSRAAPLERAKFYQILMALGVMSREEVRKAEKLDMPMTEMKDLVDVAEESIA